MGQTVDLTPSWQQIVNGLLRVYPDMNSEGRKTMHEQFLRMAIAADEYNIFMNKFCNGFNSWRETFHEIITYIQHNQYSTDDMGTGEIKSTKEMVGTLGLSQMAEQWADEFEQLNKGKEWTGEEGCDFYEEVDKFCNIKNNING